MTHNANTAAPTYFGEGGESLSLAPGCAQPNPPAQGQPGKVGIDTEKFEDAATDIGARSLDEADVALALLGDRLP